MAHYINWNNYRQKVNTTTELKSNLSFSVLPQNLQNILLNMDFEKSLRENVGLVLEQLPYSVLAEEEKECIADMMRVAMVIKVISASTILTNIKFDKEDAGQPYEEEKYKAALESFSRVLEYDVIEVMKLLKETFGTHYTLEDVWS